MKNNTLSGIVLIWITVLMLAGCTVTETSSTRVEKLDTTRLSSVNDGFVYGLSETHLTFTIEAVRKERVPGPFHQYGEKLLGLSGIPHENEVTWHIEDIQVTTNREPDYGHLYVVNPRGKFALDWDKFTRNGWIIPFDDRKRAVETSDFYRETGPDDRVLFTDLSVRKFVGQETKTVYERVWRDSIYARVPVEKTETVQKTKDQKAQEAAGFIFMIREKRFELIAGMGDYYPEGTALQAAIDEMKRLEENYLSLFKGKSFTDTLSYTIRMKPQKYHLSEPEMLFRFSSDLGVLDAEKDTGAPVWLDFSLQEDPERQKRLIGREIKDTDSNLFYYRLPVPTVVKLRFGDQVIARQHLDIDQYGPVFQMPLEFLNQSGFIRYPANPQN